MDNNDERCQRYKDRVNALYDECILDPLAFAENHPDIKLSTEVGNLHVGIMQSIADFMFDGTDYEYSVLAILGESRPLLAVTGLR